MPGCYYPHIATALREKVRWEQPLGTNTDLGGPGDWHNAHTASPIYKTTVKAYAKVLAKEDPAAAQIWLNLVQAQNGSR